MSKRMEEKGQHTKQPILNTVNEEQSKTLDIIEISDDEVDIANVTNLLSSVSLSSNKNNINHSNNTVAHNTTSTSEIIPGAQNRGTSVIQEKTIDSTLNQQHETDNLFDIFNKEEREQFSTNFLNIFSDKISKEKPSETIVKKEPVIEISDSDEEAEVKETYKEIANEIPSETNLVEVTSDKQSSFDKIESDDNIILESNKTEGSEVDLDMEKQSITAENKENSPTNNDTPVKDNITKVMKEPFLPQASNASITISQVSNANQSDINQLVSEASTAQSENTDQEMKGVKRKSLSTTDNNDVIVKYKFVPTHTSSEEKKVENTSNAKLDLSKKNDDATAAILDKNSHTETADLSKHDINDGIIPEDTLDLDNASSSTSYGELVTFTSPPIKTNPANSQLIGTTQKKPSTSSSTEDSTEEDKNCIGSATSGGQSTLKTGDYFMQDSFLDDSQRSSIMNQSEESSDDDLFELNLKTIHSLGSRPAPSTPPEENKADSNLTDEQFVEKQAARLEANKNYFQDLDLYLEKRRQEVEKEREMDRMVNKLKAGVDRGGIASYTLDETDGDLSAMHKEQLDKFSVQESVIRDSHPGERIFDKSLFKQLFDHTLSPMQCGFQAGTTYLEQQIPVLPQAMLVDMLTTGVFEQCVPTFTNPHQILDWILYIMAIHPHVSVVEKCCSVLRQILRHPEGSCGSWSPSVKHFITILVNYGSSCETLHSRYTLQELKEQLRFSGAMPPQGAAGINPPTCYGIENLRYLLKVITITVKERKRKDWYPTNDLLKIFLLIATISLDVRLSSECLFTEIQISYAVILDTFQQSQWCSVVQQLNEQLPLLTEHHHNLVHLMHLMPGSSRGSIIQRRLSLTILRRFMSLPTDYYVREPQIKVTDLFDPVRCIQPKENPDFYFIASMIALIDLCVGNEPLKAAEKKDLSKLIDMIRSLTSDVRECIAVLDRTMIKDMMVRLVSKLTFMLQNMGTKQPTLYEWVHTAAVESSQ